MNQDYVDTVRLLLAVAPAVLRIPAKADSRSGHDGQPRSEAT
jgi:hypothetical protein